ncbi:Nudix hydrolase 8 [Nymphaea thermarum]|nr:Nudix hydrolase 8 [Nymphaea thermarum]
MPRPMPSQRRGEKGATAPEAAGNGSAAFVGGRAFKPSYPTTETFKLETDVVGRSIFVPNKESRILGSNGVPSSAKANVNFLKLDAFEDEYGGIIIKSECLPADVNTFVSLLRTSLNHWRLKGKKGVWLKLPIEKSELVPVAIKASIIAKETSVHEGFIYHHAEPGYVMLTYWIPPGPCLLPSNATHQVGVGGFVVNDNKELLVVQEKHTASAFEGFWKLPTGFILEDEEIFSGAIREVREETGIETEFLEVLAFKHAHGVAFGKADLFFICLLRPLSSEIVVDELEIGDAKWMPLNEFMEQTILQKDDMLTNIMKICIARLGQQYRGLSTAQIVSMYDGKPSSLYFNLANEDEGPCT